MKAAFLILLLIVCALGFCSGALRNASLHSGYGSCWRCNRTWDVVSGHTVHFGTNIYRSSGWYYENGVKIEILEHEVRVVKGRGIFAICEQCWQDLKTPVARIPYYKAAYFSWDRSPSEWAEIEKEIKESK